MEQLEQLFAESETSWIESLPAFQREIIDSFLASNPDPQEAATKWLSATGPSNTFPFGAERSASIYYDKLVLEIEAFICGDNRYDVDRARLAEQFKPTHVYVVGAISAAVAPALGASAPLIAPAVALVLLTIGRISVNAWCTARRQLRSQSESSDS